MMQPPVITIETRRYAALIDALKLARYALLRTGRRFDCPPHDHYSVAHTIDLAIAESCTVNSEVRS
ncbi:MAG: hypothetical protein K2Y05_02470 [Hyphomicrobiaceae bacterium]|nr:hypothetical protein [Hyphomicrobiaceae bacterium]